MIATEGEELTGINESHSIGFCLLETKLSCTEGGLIFLCCGIFGVQIIGVMGSSNFSSTSVLSREASRIMLGCAGADGNVISMTDS